MQYIHTHIYYIHRYTHSHTLIFRYIIFIDTHSHTHPYPLYIPSSPFSHPFPPAYTHPPTPTHFLCSNAKNDERNGTFEDTLSKCGKSVGPSEQVKEPSFSAKEPQIYFKQPYIFEDALSEKNIWVGIVEQVGKRAMRGTQKTPISSLQCPTSLQKSPISLHKSPISP